MSNVSKSKPDKFKVLKANAEERIKVGNILSTAEKMEIALTTWHDHVIARDEIASFITIVGDKMYPMFPGENQVLLPFEEFNGDHSMNWILVWDFIEKKEIYRKNTKNVDLIDWVVKSEKK
jgi:hypothetical protein